MGSGAGEGPFGPPLLSIYFPPHPLDLTFLHEGSKTLVDGLVNIEKLVSGTASSSPMSGGLASSPSPGTPLETAAFLLGIQLAWQIDA